MISLKFQTSAKAVCIKENGWAKIKCKDLSTNRDIHVCGIWSCDPKDIISGIVFQCNVELKKYNTQNQAHMKKGTIPIPENPSQFSITNKLSANGISHTIIHRMVKEQANLKEALDNYTTFNALEGEENRKVKDIYDTFGNSISLQTKYPILNSKLCEEIVDEHDMSAIDVNPYIITQKMNNNTTLPAADAIARHRGIDSHDHERIVAHAEQMLKKLFDQEKSFWFNKQEFCIKMIDHMKKLEWSADVTQENVHKALKQCAEEDNGCVALTNHANLEIKLAQTLVKILHKDEKTVSIEYEDIDDMFDSIQKEAIQSAMKTSTIIRGCAGTGKTKVISEIVKLLLERSIEVVVVAPTGKASERVSEGLVYMKASTIHYVISHRDKYNGKELVVIADEFSMCSPELLEKLLCSINVKRLIMVGDPNQLPSIQSGALMRDCISSGIFDLVELKHIYRQSNAGTIAQRSFQIINDEAKDWEECEIPDNFSLQFTSDNSDTLQRATKKVKMLRDQGKNVQMITMTNTFANEANKVLQKIYNPRSTSTLTEFPFSQKCDKIDRGNKAPWIEGDVVINLENHYEDQNLTICNGAIGKIISLTEKEVIVQFENKKKKTFTSQAPELNHGYCLTTHKYQGSECDCIVFAINYVPSMATKDLYYTGTTRGKCEVHIFAPRNIWKIGCTKTETGRQTRLSLRLYNSRHCVKKIRTE